LKAFEIEKYIKDIEMNIVVLKYDGFEEKDEEIIRLRE
jgi:hypothetical protein